MLKRPDRHNPDVHRMSPTAVRLLHDLIASQWARGVKPKRNAENSALAGDLFARCGEAALVNFVRGELAAIIAPTDRHSAVRRHAAD